MSRSPLHHRLERSHGELRRALVLRHALRASAGLCALVALVVLAAAPLDFGEGFAWTRSALAALAGIVVMARTLARWRAERPPFESWLEQIEQRFPEVRSWLRNALDLERTPPAHTSADLAAALRDETARRLERVPLATLRPPLAARRPLLAIAASALALVLVGLAAPARVERSWSTLWDPAAAAPPLRLVVEPGSVRVAPGAALAVRARVWGSVASPRIERDGGPAMAAVGEGTSADGAQVWRFDLAMITRDELYRVRAGRVSSPRYRIALAGEPAPVSFEIEYRAPAYARLPVQRGAATRGDLEALRGTVATVTATFDRDLEALDVTGPAGAGAAWSALTPRRWRGTVTVARPGTWTLRPRARGGEATLRYRVNPLDDAPPVLSVVMPTGDVDLPEGQQVPLEVVGEDDLGLTELALQFHKDAAAPWRTLSLQRFGARPREARVRSAWDASALGLLPGESASFRFVLWDDDGVSGRKAATSPTFALRFPSLADLYERLDQSQGTVQGSLEHVAEQARELQKSLERMARQAPQARSTPQSGSSYERREEMRSALERQQDLSQRITEAAGQLHKSLEDAAERQAYDEQLMRKLREVSELMQQIQSPEFKDALQRIQKAMERMDARASEQDVKQWRDASKEMLQNLERALALLKQLRAEEQLASLAKRAEELAQQQDALNQQHGAAPPRDAAERRDRAEALAEQQKAAAERARELARETQESAKAMPSQPEQQGLQEAAEQLANEAAPEQDRAAQQQSQQQGQQAKASGERASRSLQSAAQRLSQMAQSAQERRDGADVAAVRRAAQDLVSIQRAAQDNLEATPPAPSRADRQSDLAEGVARVADSLYTLSQRSPFITRPLGEALGRAMQNLTQSGRDLARGDRARGEQSGREGSESLNQAVRELRLSESGMCQKPGQGKPGGQGSAQTLSGLGEQQSQLNQQSRALAQRLAQQMRLSAGDQSEMHRLAAEQQRLREELERIQEQDTREGRLLGRLEAAHREMEQVEEALRSGSPGDDVEQVQNRILSRLLDAQRSVNRRDFDPTRESRPGVDLARSSPAALPADLLRESDRLRLGLLKADADRYPAQYRALVESYLRALDGARR